MTDDFYGLPIRIIGNRHIRLEYLANAGPRIVRLFYDGTEENLFAEVPDKRWITPFGDYYIRGGHRLWSAPEDMPRSYMPDNEDLGVEELANGIRLTQREKRICIHKSVEIQLDDQTPRVKLVHRLKNESKGAVDLAPWAITMLRPGGIAILPQAASPLDAEHLLPNRNLVLWSYASWNDPRLEIYDTYALIQAQPSPAPFKIGYLNHSGWIAYLLNRVLFVKQFETHIDCAHPDMNCNAEVYCNDRWLELETLAPLGHLRPGDEITHIETWQLFTSIGVICTPKDVSRVLDDCGFDIKPQVVR